MRSRRYGQSCLERDETVEAKTIFEYLSRQHPERYQEGELRTLQRRIKIWRARYGLAGKSCLRSTISLAVKGSRTSRT